MSGLGDRSFGDLDRAANRLARALRARGLRAGDGVALLSGNRPEFAEVWAACLRSGLRLTPVNRHLTAAEAEYIVRDCGARALVADAGVVSAADVAAEAPGLTVRLALGGPVAGFEPYADVLASETASVLADPQLGTVMLYTSGTTGRPKGVDRDAVPAGQTGVVNLHGYRDAGDVHLCTGPLFHAAPLAISLATPLSFGVTVVLMDGWDPVETLRLVEAHRVTHTHLVPTMFHRLLALPVPVRQRYNLSSLRVVMHGAAPCPVPVKRAVIEWLGPVVWEYYAATEGTGTAVDSATWLEHPGTVGRPHPADQVVVGDDDAHPLPAGAVGLVWLKAPADNRFRYYGDIEKTERSYRGEHFTLGDLGYLDADGFLFLTDRRADVIITGGVNVYSAEVDAVLLAHRTVGDAATIGIPDDEWGEIVVAVVEPRAGFEPTPELAEELLVHCRAHLAHFKCPRRVDFATALPRLDNGKLAKHRLREQYRS